jgi:hypothetical protein
MSISRCKWNGKDYSDLFIKEKTSGRICKFFCKNDRLKDA